MNLNGVIALTFAYLLPNLIAFWAQYVKVVEETPILSAAEM